ncbi:MAG: alpha/beta hydrolase [Bacilli bacterium]|nr:alpha/beta hydrolase [Bacilli bacterium]
MRIIKDIEYAPGLKLDVYLPDGDGFKTLVYFHGGGIVDGDKAEPQYVEMMTHFAESGIAGVSVNYTLYPKAKYPSYFEEAAKSIRFVKDHLKEWGGNGDIYVSGQSAGAYMIMMLCLNEKYLKEVGMSTLDIKGWVSDSGQMSDHFHVLEYEKKVDPWLQRISEAAPLYYVGKDTKTNPVVLIWYEDDMFCREEQNLLLLKNLKYYVKDVDVESVKLSGGHCSGSSFKDPDGEYPYVKVAKDWINRH